jgi:hypothetical protein
MVLSQKDFTNAKKHRLFANLSRIHYFLNAYLNKKILDIC